MRTRSNFIGKANLYASGSLLGAECARPLNILRDIDELSACARLTVSILEARLEYGEEVMSVLATVTEPVSEEVIIPEIERCQANIKKVHEQYADVLPWLSEMSRPHDDAQDIVEKAIHITAEMYKQLEAMRWAILEHNVDAGAKGESKKLTSDAEIEGFFASL
ncbi:TPA: hypothetical protein ACQVH3_005168 [Serratia marcescens]